MSVGQDGEVDKFREIGAEGERGRRDDKAFRAAAGKTRTIRRC